MNKKECDRFFRQVIEHVDKNEFDKINMVLDRVYSLGYNDGRVDTLAEFECDDNRSYGQFVHEAMYDMGWKQNMKDLKIYRSLLYDIFGRDNIVFNRMDECYFVAGKSFVGDEFVVLQSFCRENRLWFYISPAIDGIMLYFVECD